MPRTQGKPPPDFLVAMTATVLWSVTQPIAQGNDGTFLLRYFPKQRVYLCQARQGVFLCGGCLLLLCHLPPRSRQHERRGRDAVQEQPVVVLLVLDRRVQAAWGVVLQAEQRGELAFLHLHGLGKLPAGRSAAKGEDWLVLYLLQATRSIDLPGRQTNEPVALVERSTDGIFDLEFDPDGIAVAWHRGIAIDGLDQAKRALLDEVGEGHAMAACQEAFRQVHHQALPGCNERGASASACLKQQRIGECRGLFQVCAFHLAEQSGFFVMREPGEWTQKGQGRVTGDVGWHGRHAELPPFLALISCTNVSVEDLYGQASACYTEGMVIPVTDCGYSLRAANLSRVTAIRLLGVAFRSLFFLSCGIIS